MKHYKIINNECLFGGKLTSHNFTFFTYNVSWQSMTSNVDNQFEICKDGSGNNLCKSNILFNISYYLKKFIPDFVCFQEATNYNNLLNIFDENIYKNFINKSGKEYMATLWNNHKFSLVKSFSSEFEKGRPFAILILKYLKNNKNIALINIHASHEINTQKYIFDIINNFIKNNISYYLKKSITNVFMVGDFNRNIKDDTIDYNIIFSKIFTLNKMSNNKPTCCSMLGYGFNRDYDHVIVSNGSITKKITTNSSKKYKFPSSDHIMVISNANVYF